MLGFGVWISSFVRVIFVKINSSGCIRFGAFHIFLVHGYFSVVCMLSCDVVLFLFGSKRVILLSSSCLCLIKLMILWPNCSTSVSLRFRPSIFPCGVFMLILKFPVKIIEMHKWIHCGGGWGRGERVGCC